jgi:sugar phosphate permease
LRNYLIFVITLAIILVYVRSQGASSWQGLYLPTSTQCSSSCIFCATSVLGVQAINSSAFVAYSGQWNQTFTGVTSNTLNATIFGDTVILTRTSTGITVNDKTTPACSTSIVAVSPYCPHNSGFEFLC